MKKLYYLRHGLSEMNVAGLFAGTTETNLTDDGKQKALQAGIDAKGIQIDKIICSPQSRALETAKLFIKGAGLDPDILTIDERLKERDFGSLEGTPWSKELSSNLLDDNLPEGVETWSHLTYRAESLLNEIKKNKEENILLVGHGSIGRAIRKIIITNSDLNDHLKNSKIVRWI